ncbi:hypothetical protein PInf_024314 [Phytophthora infestans]|nr:hypothetical protein PInf_024314 [Phytophthora infestans]
MATSLVRSVKGVPRYPPWLQKALKIKDETEQFWIKQHQVVEVNKQKQQRPKSRAPEVATTAQSSSKPAEESYAKSESFVNVWVSIAADDALAVKMFLEETKGVEGGGGGESLLHEASYVGSLKVVRFLVTFMQTHFAPQICVDAVNAVDTQYSLTTPMIAACRNSLGAIANRVEIVKLLVEAGGDTARRDSHGDNVLHCVAKLQLDRNRCLSTLTVVELLVGVNSTCNLRLKMRRIRRHEDLVRAEDSAYDQEQLAAVLELSERLVPQADKLWREAIEGAERSRKAQEQQHVDTHVEAAATAAHEWLETKTMPKPKDFKAAAKQRVQDLYVAEKELSARKAAIEAFVAHHPPYPRDRVAELRRMLQL